MAFAAQKQYWISIEKGQPEQMTHADVVAHVEQGTDILLMTLDQSSGWQAPSEFGIVKTAPDTPAAPTPPSAPAAPTAPVAPSPTEKNEPGFFAKASGVADKLLSGVSDKLARKLAKMAGQPDPVTGEQTVTPHQAPVVETAAPATQETQPEVATTPPPTQTTAPQPTTPTPTQAATTS